MNSLQHWSIANEHICLNVSWTGGGADEEQSLVVWFRAYAVPWLQQSAIVSDIWSIRLPKQKIYNLVKYKYKILKLLLLACFNVVINIRFNIQWLMYRNAAERSVYRIGRGNLIVRYQKNPTHLLNFEILRNAVAAVDCKRNGCGFDSNLEELIMFIS